MRDKVFRKFVIIGLSLITGGTLLLLWTNGLISLFGSVGPVFVICCGLFFFYRVYIKHYSDMNIFPGMFLFFIGIFLLIRSEIMLSSEIAQYWPLFMSVLGVSIIAYGFKRKSPYRFPFIIPGSAIIILSIIFLGFSTDLIKISFKDFVVRWWPFLLILSGVVFISLYVYYSLKEKRKISRNQ